MLYVAYLNPFEVQMLNNSDEYTPDNIEKKWLDKLGYIPVMACGSDYPRDLFVSSMIYLPDYPVAALLFLTDEAIRIDREEYYSKRRDIQQTEKRPLEPDEILACRFDGLSDERALFLCRPKKNIMLIPLAGLSTNPKEILEPVFKQLFADAAGFLASSVAKHMDMLNSSIKELDVSMSQYEDKEAAQLLKLSIKGKTLLDMCLLPLLASMACDADLDETTINVNIDLECMFYGMCCPHRAQDIASHYISLLLDNSVVSLDERNKMLGHLKECYIDDPRVLTAHQTGIGANDPCPCGCGKKWKKHYGNFVEPVIKAAYPNMHRTYAKSPQMLPINSGTKF